MTSPQLNGLWTLASLFLMGQTASSGTFRFEDTAKNLLITAREARVAQMNNGYRLLVVGDVVVTERDQGTELRTSKLTATTLGNSEKSELNRGIAEGKVRILKKIQNSAGAQTTVITGKNADYRAGKPAALVDIAGPVTLTNTNPQKRETLSATGSHARAWLANGLKTSEPNALRKAILDGPARVVVLQAKSEKSSRLVAKGEKLTLDTRPEGRTILIEGHVQVHGEGSSRIFAAENQRRVTLRLNSRDEITSFDAEAYR